MIELIHELNQTSGLRCLWYGLLIIVGLNIICVGITKIVSIITYSLKKK